jgi:hypothetical protein
VLGVVAPITTDYGGIAIKSAAFIGQPCGRRVDHGASNDAGRDDVARVEDDTILFLI